ncbi:dihydrolipoamide acetyltransferase family protein [Streptomyces flaveus]|uniref:Dihydrolipoamide acetyltransferase component of pyruvate dehydrogenase complex n=1 Tax=Streptomyces flaveus TaxID=66370 RepID=A0A917R0L1_9ACTN|nr:dihydrolipoamide acetyltransferase family protein [Streptomyces flaveus]GGK80100.1 dihydrolipoamide acetyltransferase component of pyruvate dehydrogenase complex [Streptomyces flaveus]
MTTATLHEQLFKLPDLGEGLTDAEIIEWKVAVGDTVTIDQIVVEVETAKAAVEVPVPYAGTVLRLHAEAGSAVGVGEPLITVGAITSGGGGAGDGSGDPSPGEFGTGARWSGSADGPGGGMGEALGSLPSGKPVAGPVPADPAAVRYREEEQAGSGNVLIGYGTGHEPALRRRRRRAGAATAIPGPVAEAAPAIEPHAPRVISPLVRRMARDHGVDLTVLVPSGPAGVVLRRDVEQAVAQGARHAEAPSGARASAEPTPASRLEAAPVPRPGPAPVPRPETAPDGPVRIPLRGVRKAVADKLSRSRAEIPDATTWVDVDATGLLQAKKALEAAEPGRRVGLLALFARICVAGLRRYPELNSAVDTERREILRYDEVHLGFAAQTERGLVVPVVRDAHRLTTVQLAAELARLTELARTGSLPPDRLTGGTFTLNNYGVFGVDGSTPIINHPEAALLGVGRIVDKPWVVDGALAVRKVTQLSLSFDHRVCDGGTAGGFLRFVADCVERPAILLADV